MAFSTIDKSSSFMNPKLYTGTGSSLALTGVGFQPDLLWIKSRSASTDNWITNAINGSTLGCQTNSNAAQTTYTAGVTSFDSDGFTCGAQPSGGDTNANTATYASWNWKANGSGSANTDGTINTTSTSANTTAGISIIKYVGNGTQDSTIGHGLGIAPKFVMIKSLSQTQDWAVGHITLPFTKYMTLNSTAASSTASNRWGNANPGTSVITLGDQDTVNTTGDDYICYAFAEVAGYSKFSGYTGNGADEQFIYTGFAPSFILFKGTSHTSSWMLFDKDRLTYNATYGRDRVLYPYANYAEADMSADGGADFLSNGFCFRGTASMTGTDELNESGHTYIYMAFGQPIVSNSGVPATAR